MNHYNLSQQLGLFQSDISNIANGKPSYNIAQKLGIFETDLRNVLNGRSSHMLSQKIGINQSDLQVLLNDLGKNGSAGLIIGLLINLKPIAPPQ